LTSFQEENEKTGREINRKKVETWERVEVLVTSKEKKYSGKEYEVIQRKIKEKDVREEGKLQKGEGN
jgi:hypothetical protein